MTKQGKNRDIPDRGLLLKYLRGELSSREAHQLEKRIQEDPFYQDALDGMESVDTPDLEMDLKALSEKIRQRSAKSGRSRILVYRWAATVSLLAIFSFLIYMTITRMDELSDREVITQKQTPQDMEKSAKQGKHDSDLPERLDADTQKEQAVKPDHELNKTGKAFDESPENMTEDKSGAEENTPVNQQSIGDTESEYSETTPGITETLAGDMEPESDEESMKESVNPAIAKEKSESLTLSDVEETVSPSEELTVRQAIDQKSKEVSQPTLTGKEPAVTEAAVTEDVSDRSDLKRARLENEAVPSAVSLEEIPEEKYAVPEESAMQAEPVIGFKAYGEYIKNNLRYPSAEEQMQKEGIVEVAFTVGQDSIPDNFRILRSLSENYDREAIRLIREGPRWIPRGESAEIREVEVRYQIPFNLK